MINRIKIRSIILSLIVLGLFVSSAMAAMPGFISGSVVPSPGNTSDNFIFTARFSDFDNHTLSANVTISGKSYPMTADSGDTNTTDGITFTYSNNSMVNATHTYNFSASDGLGNVTPSVGAGTVQVNNPALGLTITGPDPTPNGPYSVDVDKSITITLSATDGNGTYTYSDNASSTNLSSFKRTNNEIKFIPVVNDIGAHYVNISVTSGGQTVGKLIKFTINAPGASGGNRIWTKDFNDPYVWNAQSFTGFYYNIDDDITTEEIEITGMKTSRTIKEGDIKYSTKPQSVSFEFDGWGEYDVVGFMAEKYFAGYNINTSSKITSDRPSLLNDNMLSKVLRDDNEKYTLYQGDSLNLDEGYAIKINQLDLNGNQVMLEILKDGKSVDTGIVNPGNNPTYAYTKDVGAVDKLPIIVLHIESVFQGTETAAVTIDGLFQISSEYKSVEAGDKYGLMEVSSADSDELKLESSKDISCLLYTSDAADEE